VEHDEHTLPETQDTGGSSNSPDPSVFAWTTPTPAEVELGDRIGPYRLDRLLGQGGFGMVYLAQQLEPVRRRVALKLIKPGMDSRQVLARFAHEQQALAALDHPHIARIYDAGMTPDGRPYFAMELVEGEAITRFCERHALTLRQRLELFRRVCDAVQHAHQHGIIHRDLKPSNILVSMVDGRPTPKIIDFGVAKAMADDPTSSQTIEGQILGTPEYMSPEQAEHGASAADTRSDVYSLGVLLYELLTGERPIDADTLRAGGTASLQRALREADPPVPSTRVLRSRATPARHAPRMDPRDLARRLRGDLDWITMRAMDKDRERRYPSPRDLSDDIGRHLEGRPVLAGPPTLTYRTAKFIRRHRIAVTTAIVILSLSGSFLGALGYQWMAFNASIRLKNTELSRANEALETANQTLALTNETLDARNRELLRTRDELRDQRDEAREAREEALTQREIAEQNARRADRLRRRAEHAAYANEVSRALQGWEFADFRTTVRALTHAEELAGGWEIGAIRAAFDQSTRVIDLTRFDAAAATFSPALDRFVVATRDGRIRLVSRDGADERASPASVDDEIARVRASLAGKACVTLSRTGRVHVWDLRTLTPNCEVQIVTGVPSAVAISTSATWIAVGDSSGRVSIRDARTGDPIVTRRPHDTPVLALAFSPDDAALICASQGRDLARMTTNAWTLRKGARTAPAPIRTIAFDDQRILTADEAGTLLAWDTQTLAPEPLATFPAPLLSVARRDDLLAVATTDFALHLLVADEDGAASSVGHLSGHREAIEQVHFLDGRHLLSIDRAMQVRLWDLRAPGIESIAPRLHHTRIVRAVASIDGQVIVTCAADALLRIWDARTLRPARKAAQIALDAPPIDMAASAEGVVVLDERGVLRIIDPLAGDIIATRVLSEATPTALAVRAHDGLVLVALDSGEVLVLDPITLDTVDRFEAHGARINDISISADGRRAVTVSDDMSAIVWSVDRRSPILRIDALDHRPLVCAIDPSAEVIALGDEAGLVHVHATSSSFLEYPGERRHDPDASPIGAPIAALAFSPDGQRLVSCDRGGLAVVWDPAYPEPICRLTQAPAPITHASFDPMDERLLLARADGRLEIWRAQPDQPRPDPSPRLADPPPNATILDAFCVSMSGERIEPVAGEPFSIAVLYRSEALAGQVLTLTRTVDGASASVRVSAANEEPQLSLADAWRVDHPAIIPCEVRLQAHEPDAIPGDDVFRFRIRVRPRTRQ